MTIRRPCVWLCTIFIILVVGIRFFQGEDAKSRLYPYDSLLEDGQIPACVCGTFYRAEITDTSTYRMILRHATLYVEGQNPTQFSQFLIYFDSPPDADFGNKLRVTGMLSTFPEATNPGQFDMRAYYREQMIFYCLFDGQAEVLSEERQILQAALYRLRQRLCEQTNAALPAREAGIVNAMLFGEKSALPEDIQSLYRQNGMGHLLAISGLHITILCMGLYRFLLLCKMPRHAAIPLALFLLYCYGSLTGFGISTCRAVIMTACALIADWLGKSYDLPSALALSAMLTLLARPEALSTGSFLLSYGAVLGISLFLPVLQECVWGDAAARRERQRRKRRQGRELATASFLHRLPYYQSVVTEAVCTSLLASAAIQLSTLPVVLWFFYEVPVYGIIINVLVLPFVPIVLLLGAAAVIAGLISLPLSCFFFGGVYGVLRAYEMLCRMAGKLPMHTVILGRPALWQIVLYILIILFPLCVRKCRTVTHKTLIIWAAAVILLIFPKPHPFFSATFLDVGQGDGIFMQSPSGDTFLIDGGSTSKQEIGKNCLIPFLKSQGVSRLDYLLMTHADDDHISGQLELLDQAVDGGGIAIRCLLLPEPSVGMRAQKGYRAMLQAAGRAGVPIRHIHAGEVWQNGALRINCLHPPKNYETDSANAYSVTLEVHYGQTDLLLCGDLEGEGEEQVTALLRESQRYFDVLKVSHHGSKNSTGVDFLQEVKPELAVISCGRNNRYGHPHRELLERLETVQAHVLQTPHTGAVCLYSDGVTYQIRSFL